MSVGVQVHDGIRELKPYEPGKPISDVARELGLDKIVKLASNENPLGPSPLAIARVLEVASEMHRYPDGPATELRQKICQKYGLRPESIVFGNGSNELLELALRTFVRPGELVITSETTFSVYGILAAAHGARFATVPMTDMHYDLDALADQINNQGARLVFLANPNNPTGTAFGIEPMREFMARIPDDVVVVYDAAYAEYGAPAGVPDGLSLIDDHPNLITSRTFSKSYGLAGFRIGWGAMSPRLADYMNRVRQPFNVSRIAQEAACAALDDDEFLQRTLDQNRRSLAYFKTELDAIGLESWPSHANFLLFKSPVPADELFQMLMRQGVIVRSMSGFGLPDHVRVNTGTDDENRFFVSALKHALSVD